MIYYPNPKIVKILNIDKTKHDIGRGEFVLPMLSTSCASCWRIFPYKKECLILEVVIKYLCIYKSITRYNRAFVSCHDDIECLLNLQNDTRQLLIRF